MKQTILGALLALSFLLAATATRAEPALPRARAARAQGVVVLDGRLDEPCWREAPAQSGFQALSKKRGEAAPPEETTFRVAFNDEALLLGILCREPRMADAIARTTERDGRVWTDDSVEILIQPGPRFYYQFAVNTLGAVYDARLPARPGLSAGEMQQGVLWDGAWEAAVARGADEWSLEARIPFAALDLGPETAASWRLNVGRTAARRNEYSAWAPVQNGFHDLPLFGWLDGLEVDFRRFTLDGADLQLPPLFVGRNRVALSLPARAAGPYRVSTSLRPWAPGRLPARRPQGEPLRAAGGALPLSLDVPVERAGTLYELVVEIADVATSAPVLLRECLFKAPDPFACSLDWAVVYRSDRQATATVTVSVAEGSARGRVSARLLGSGATPVAVVEQKVERPGALRLSLPVTGLPEGPYRVEVTADLPEVGTFRQELRCFVTAGPFEGR